MPNIRNLYLEFMDIISSDDVDILSSWLIDNQFCDLNSFTLLNSNDNSRDKNVETTDKDTLLDRLVNQTLVNIACTHGRLEMAKCIHTVCSIEHSSPNIDTVVTVLENNWYDIFDWYIDLFDTVLSDTDYKDIYDQLIQKNSVESAMYLSNYCKCIDTDDCIVVNEDNGLVTVINNYCSSFILSV